ncbi:hypothetical protein EGM97_23150 [Pseudomonas sp. AF32]|nr:hypothetical protein [Pseudomonas sp. AF32]
MKRAYELSVCIFRTVLQKPDYRVDGCAWRIGVASTVNVNAEPVVSVQRVLFSFHIVEIS